MCQQGPEKVMNVTQAGEIRRVICYVSSPCPAGYRGAGGTGCNQATGQEETGTPPC